MPKDSDTYPRKISKAPKPITTVNTGGSSGMFRPAHLQPPTLQEPEDIPDERIETLLNLMQSTGKDFRQIIRYILGGHLVVYNPSTLQPLSVASDPLLWVTRQILARILQLPETERNKALDAFWVNGGDAEIFRLKIEAATGRVEKSKMAAPKAEQAVPSNNKVFPCERGTKWEQVKITLLSDKTVKIKTPQGEGRFSYQELGFKDARRSDKAIGIWNTLKLFCRLRGKVDYRATESYDPKLIKHVSLLNKHLQRLFNIDQKLTGHYKTHSAWESPIIFDDITQDQIAFSGPRSKGRCPISDDGDDNDEE